MYLFNSIIETNYILVCGDGTYIENKTCIKCYGHCKNGTTCNKLSGQCEDGCDEYWTGEFCQSKYLNHAFTHTNIYGKNYNND